MMPACDLHDAGRDHGRRKQMVELNRTERAAAVAAFMQDENFESHRGALRWKKLDTVKTDCIVLYGNDGYSPQPGVVVESGGASDADYRARTMAYVHGLYVGWSNLLPEGAIEFGTTSDGYTWAIVLHLPKRPASMPMLLRSLVWDLWQANLPNCTCTKAAGGAR
jgi:hypothetical protein